MRQPSGFTLVELIVYTGIVAILLSVISGINQNLQTYLRRSRVYSDVQRNFSLIANRLTLEIRGARDIGIGQSVFGTNPGKLSLVTADTLLNPTVFETTDASGRTVLTIRQGTGPSYALAGNTITVDTLLFYNLSSPSGKSKTVGFVLGVRYYNPGNLDDLQYRFVATSSVQLLDTL